MSVALQKEYCIAQLSNRWAFFGHQVSKKDLQIFEK